jgi:hypothetical protein
MAKHDIQPFKWNGFCENQFDCVSCNRERAFRASLSPEELDYIEEVQWETGQFGPATEFMAACDIPWTEWMTKYVLPWTIYR